MRRRAWSAGALCLTLIAGCTSSETDSDATPTTAGEAATTASPATTSTAVEAAPTSDIPAPSFTLRPGPLQLTVLDAEPGTSLRVERDGDPVAEGVVDEAGGLVFRQLEPGTHELLHEAGGSVEVEILSVDAHPSQAFYDDQVLAEGFGYITARDGTTLSANVVLPGEPEDGPYPTVVEYSGYAPSDPDASGFGDLFTALGYAYVGVNIRGTGCSGGSFQFFEPVQSTDGYDVIEAVAAQDWVANDRVGMVGVSYPGIAQLFVAQTQPPHLAAITPLSVLDDSYTATLYPGGILNTGFAVPWAAERQAQAEAYGQGWTEERADAGDEECAANQELRGQNPDALALVEDNPYYDPALYDTINPSTFVDRIDVPVFLAGAWQDEQTGGHFPNFLDRFTSAPHLYATLVNGLHTESISLGILPEYLEFLSLYVAGEAPDLSTAAFSAPVLAQGIFGAGGELPASELAGLSYDDALAAFEARPPIRVLFEEGAADGAIPGSPLPRFEARFESWPVANAETRTWFLRDGGSLLPEPGAAEDPAVSYEADPDAVPATFFEGGSSEIWRADVTYDWTPAHDKRAAWMTPPLEADTVVVGTGSVDLWLRSSAADTDLEVTISELRPDGTELYVQSGWLRASHRALSPEATDLRPVHTHLEADAEPLPAGEFTEVRVELFPVAHPFRAGSRLVLSVDAPGGNRPVWEFRTISDGETNEIAQDAARPSALVLPVVPGVAVPPGVAACGAVRGQPCASPA